MSLVRSARVCAGIGLIVTGCRSAPQPAFQEPSRTSAAVPSPDRGHEPIEPVVRSSAAEEVRPISFDEPSEPAAPSVNNRAHARPDELSLPQLIAEVHANNPSLQAMIAAWRAASERYPQVVSLEDPMFGFMVGPASWDSDDVDAGYMLEASQKLPWPGKRDLRGRAAQAEATAARMDVGETRLRLTEAAKLSFYDYYLAVREAELNRENLDIVQEFKDAAQARYRANQVTQQDVLQADVELAELRRRQFELERMRKVSIARINTLLHRCVDCPLGPPPQALLPADEPPPVEHLRQLAIGSRPELAAVGARIRAERAAAELACREFYPDFEIIARYDAFWQDAEKDLRPQVGMNMNVPIYHDKRRAAAREAMYRVSQRQAEFQQRIHDIQNEVQAGYERFIESRQVAKLYGESILPAVEQNVSAARSGYIAGRIDFLRLVEAQRQAIMVREKRYEAEADVRRRAAELERLVGVTDGAGIISH